MKRNRIIIVGGGLAGRNVARELLRKEKPQEIELKSIYYHERSYTPGLSASPDVFRRALEKLF